MVKILICICSRDINKLKVSLESIIKLRLSVHEKIEILLVDNSKNSEIKKYSNYLNSKNKIKINYFYLPNRGIPNLRNKCLREAKKIKSDLLCFIDDDSKIPNQWIKKNLNFFKKFRKCSIISGPQYSSKKNVYHDLLSPKFKNFQKINWCPTNNVMLKKDVINKTTITFDVRLKNIGGSDQLFFNKLSLKGFEIRWNKENPVIEIYQNDRNNLNWFIKRIFRYASSSVLIVKFLFGSLFGAVRSLMKIFYYSIKFTLSLILIPLNPKLNFLKSLHYLIRSLSIILGFCGIFPKKYI